GRARSWTRSQHRRPSDRARSGARPRLRPAGPHPRSSSGPRGVDRSERLTGLAVEDAFVGYKSTDVLRGTSVLVHPGECVAILGPNGAGKSTLLRAISGQLKLRAGR